MNQVPVGTSFAYLSFGIVDTGVKSQTEQTSTPLGKRPRRLLQHATSK